MPHEPKKRHSRQRQGKHRANMHISLPMLMSCPECKKLKLPHMLCPHCGYYDGRNVLNLKEKPEEKKVASLDEDKKRSQT